MTPTVRAHLYRSASDPSNLVVTVAAADLLELLQEPLTTYDSAADAAYIYLAGEIPAGGVGVTKEAAKDIYLDFDKEGHLIGIELLRGELLHPALMTRSAIYNPAPPPYIALPEPKDQER
jgi:uncharacterized protein YuzE